MSPARDVARAVLRRVEQGEAYASLALAGELARARLSPADSAFATEIVYGVLRHRTRLDRALASYAPRGLKMLAAPVRVALRVGAYQILFLRVPAHAAVDDAVEAVKRTAGERAAGFANAVLRKLAAQGEPPPPPRSDVYAYLEAHESMPRWITERLRRALGDEEAIACAAAMNTPAPVGLRVSLDRVGRDDVLARLGAERPAATIVPSPYLPEGILLHGGGAPETLAVFQEGLVTVQDIAAQLVSRLCGAAPGERILDACAGVGGKSTHLAQLAILDGGPARIDAADLSRRKLDLAEDAVRRLRLSGIRTVEADLTAPPDALVGPYDRILLDAPCSGLGVLRRHPEGKWRRRNADVLRLAALQARLLDALAPRVREGGILVYSVCTFTDEEGPEQVARFLQRHPDFALTPPAGAPGVDFAPFLNREGHFRSWPHRHDADAFFAVRLTRRGSWRVDIGAS